MIRLISHMDAEELFMLVDENRAYLRKWLPWLDYNKTVDHVIYCKLNPEKASQQ